MSLQPGEPIPSQHTEEAKQSTQNVVVQRIPFHQPQIGPLRHILQETRQGGSSKEYDSYKHNRP
jgi:hypothetical protein